MSWTSIDLKNISTETQLIPAGTYTFELSPGAKINEHGTLMVQARVVNDGEFTGKPVFFSYPDPESVSQKGTINQWSAVAFKRFTQALGEDLQDGEGPDAYLNRVAGARFSMPVEHSKPSDEYPNPRVNARIFNVKPAA